MQKFLSRCMSLLVAAVPLLAAGQEGLWDVPRVGGETITEPSPEATAMRRYQDFPVSYATGTADISIPLLDLPGGQTGVSLGLRYHTGGIQATDYYPYGMPMATSTGAAVNRYKYSGKELETRNGLNFYDFDARLHFPAINLMNQPDALAHKKPDVSPYVYCNSNPINFVDPLGMDTINVRYVDNKWQIAEPIIAEGDDVFIVTNGDQTETYVFNEGEYGNRVCALNLEVGKTKSDLSLGVYHVSGSSEAHGYYVTPGGKPNNNDNSYARIKLGTYPISEPKGKVEWRCAGLGGTVLDRGIRFHYGWGTGAELKIWTLGCFVLSTNYELVNGSYKFNKNESMQAYKAFGLALDSNATFFDYEFTNSKGVLKKRIGTSFTHSISHKLILKGVKSTLKSVE